MYPYLACWANPSLNLSSWTWGTWAEIQYIPRNIHTVTALLCFVVVKHWLIFPYPSGLLHWHCGNLTIAPVPAKQPWWIWINTSCDFIMNDCITTTKQSTTKPCAYFLGYTVHMWHTKLICVVSTTTRNPGVWSVRFISLSDKSFHWDSRRFSNYARDCCWWRAI